MANTRSKKKETAPAGEAIEKVDTTTPPTKTTIIPDEGARANAEGCVTGTVICQNLNVRKEPAMGTTILKTISKGTKVTILESASEEWYKVHVNGIGTGFCMKEFLKVGE